MKRSLLPALFLSVLLSWVLAFPALADSNVRIVRVSDVEGNVEIDRGTGQGYEKAFLNMPITQGVKLKTGDDGRAEVEFEDNSIIHVVPNSELQFTDLALSDSGAKISTVDIGKGEAYVNFTGKKDDEFTVTFAHEKSTLTRSAHFRLRVDEDRVELAVFDGDVQINGPAGEVKLSKKETATFDLTNQDQYKVAKKIEKDPFDAWDKHEEEYHERYEASNSYGSPYNYGYSDLNYYGNYMMYPGCGMCWQPYFTGMGWSPYMDGAWMLYPGFGYTWVSAYPWGWTPYHYGSWMFLPAYGWVWQPGNSWVAWNAVPPVLNAPRNYVPPRPPRIGPSMVPVGRGPTATSLMPGARPGSKLVLNRPMAGIGVPRGIENLSRVNRTFETHGQAKVGVPGGSRGSAIIASPVDRGGRPMAMPGSGGGHWGSTSGAHASSSSGHPSGGTTHK